MLLLASEVFCSCRSSCRQGVNAFRSGCSVVLAAADTQSRLSLWQTWPPCDRNSRFRAGRQSPLSSRRSSSARRCHVAVRRGRGVAAIDARPTSSLQSVVIDGQLRPDRPLAVVAVGAVRPSYRRHSCGNTCRRATDRKPTSSFPKQTFDTAAPSQDTECRHSRRQKMLKIK